MVSNKKDGKNSNGNICVLLTTEQGAGVRGHSRSSTCQKAGLFPELWFAKISSPAPM
jgi:hypothetical protein